MTNPNPLTRDQKLMGGVIIQLGNIVEALNHSGDENNSTELESQITTLQQALADTSKERSDLTSSLATANEQIAQLQLAIAQMTHDNSIDLTPDTIQEVLDQLDIEVGE